MDWSEGDFVWFDPGLGHPIPGEIQEVHRAAQVIIVQALIKGKPQTFTLAPGEGNLRQRQDLGSNGVDDMTQLQDLHEASLLWNLKIRYDKGLIYTFAGSILIAINPYKMFPDSYGIEIAKQYVNKPLGILPPHLFAIGSAAHASLPQPQVVVISGESGSGKTESTKLVMQYLAAVIPGGGTTSTVITEQILEAAPLLEAFGNARTIRNDNSSRFGKYLEVYFKSGAIVGAKITQYLLEKSRIVTQAPGERNYHVFYEMLGGLNDIERSKYGLLEANKYFYLNQGSTDCTPVRMDWESLQSAMQVLGVTEIQRETIIRILASVLHLGNIYFHRRQLRHGQEGVEIGSDAEIKWAAHLLQISPDGLYKSLTARLTETRSERLHTPLSIDQALDARDAFAKALYSGLFNWLVMQINSIVHKGGTHDAHRISILDIFGFENFNENSFEQLCINYANENLHLYFNKHIFKLEQAEYNREHLEWQQLMWNDNLPVIHLLAKKPVGIFHLLDDESNFPRASDVSFLDKCHYNHALNELYSRPRIGAQEFGITHYAGQVWYCVDGFLDKNRDSLRSDVIELLSTSKLQLIIDMTKQLRAQRDSGKILPKGSNGRFITMKPRTPTVAARFSDSLQQLLSSMSKCNPWFVRCIKPNNDKQALKIDMPCILQQLRYLGMLDTIQIRQKGYPVRLRFQHFVERYRHLIKTTLPRGISYRELCRMIVELIPKTHIDGPDYQLGVTRVFLREILHRQLENGRSECLRNSAIIIQKNIRGLLARKRFLRQQNAAIKIQKLWRGYKQYKNYILLKKSIIKLQSLWRGKLQRKYYNKLKIEMKRKQDIQKLQKERQIQKLTKENNERNQIAYLDIPAELAFIFSKIDIWQPIYGDRNLIKIVGTIPGPPTPNDIPNDLNQFSFGKFSSVYCNGIKLIPRREPIIIPFLTRSASRDQDFQDSIAIFKLILRWTNDTTLDNNKEKLLADYIVYKGLSSRSLRDEILVQLCNQIYRNDDKLNLRIWQLMGYCLSCFQPGPAFNKYLIKFITDNCNEYLRQMLLKKLLRNSNIVNIQSCRLYPPTWLEWKSITKQSDIAISLILPDNIIQTIAIDSWTTCEEAASLAISSLDIPSYGWTVVLDDSGIISDTCGLDYILDLVSEKELCPGFPIQHNELLRSGRKNSRIVTADIEMNNINKRPLVPPPQPPSSLQQQQQQQQEQQESDKLLKNFEIPIPKPNINIRKLENKRSYENQSRKISHELLSRSSALNERYFEVEKTRSRSLDDLLSNDTNDAIIIQETEQLTNLGLSESRLNDRYHSAERLTPITKEPIQHYQKSNNAGRKTANLHNSKYIEKSEYATRSSAMSDTSEAPSLASHVRRVRVPSQASDVDQFLDDLFSPVLDGSLDELSDARSLAASIRGGHFDDFLETSSNLDESIKNLACPKKLISTIKGGYPNTTDEFLNNLLIPIKISKSISNLTDTNEMITSIKGGGSTTHQNGATTNGFVTTSTVMSRPLSPLTPINTNQILMMDTISNDNLIQVNNKTSSNSSDQVVYQQQMQRAFLQSAMAQNLRIQQQLLAQNQALQTLLSQQETQQTSPTSLEQTQNSLIVRKQSIKNHRISQQFSDIENNRKISIPPPPPPPMPPPIEFKDPFEARPFLLDPYGRAKTVRIGKWRWPPAQDQQQNETDENFLHFKMRQSQRKTTPQSQNHSSDPGSPNSSTIEWEEFEVESGKLVAIQLHQHQMKEQYFKKNSKQEASGQDIILHQHRPASKTSRRSFEIGAERPPPGSVGKLKLSSEMRQRLEQVTAGHSVRSSASGRSDQRAPAKLEDTRRMMLQQQLSGNLIENMDRPESPELPSVRSQIQRMEANKRPPPPAGPAPPPPICPPSTNPPAPPPVPKSPPNQRKESDIENYQLSGRQQQKQKQQQQQQQQDIPAFVQRQERDTFGVRHNWAGSDISREAFDSWGRAEAAKLDLVYEANYKKETNIEHERSRSRSRSRDRENFSESVWDRSEVEGPASSGSEREREKEREKRDRIFEMQQVERERESNKVYQPQKPVSLSKLRSSPDKMMQKKLKSNEPIERATFKTHMVQKYAKERERKTSASTLISQSTEKLDDTDFTDDWPTPIIPAPVPIPSSNKSQANACLTYHRVQWKLRVRKEVFHPNETIGPTATLDLLFAQITSDVFGLTSCLRITSQEKRNAINLLANNGVTIETLNEQIRTIVKRNLIEMARGWPLYFSRLFVVNGAPQFPDVTILAVSHNGVHLARRESDGLIVIRSMPYTDLHGAVTLPRPASLQLNMRNGSRIILHATKASAIQNMVQTFCHEFRQAQSKVSTISLGARAAAQTLNVPLERLETNREIISPPHHHLISNDNTEKIHNQRNEQFSNSHQNLQNSHHHINTVINTNGYNHHDSTDIQKQQTNTTLHNRKSSNHQNSIQNSNIMDQLDDDSMIGTPPSTAKYSLIQFAMQHFRGNDYSLDDNRMTPGTTNRGEKRSTSIKPHVELVKWQGTQIRAPLLRLPSELASLALECFDCILRYCGDIPPDPELTEVKCVYTVLMHCHKHLALRDEVYCQLMKQTTTNRSPCPDSSQRAWRLLSILAAYFGCSDALRPYLMEHLTAAASDRRRSCHGTAAVCLTNLRKTARCGGRKNVPSVEEVTAVSAGRSARRQIYRLPGGAERVVNTRCSTVVADVISELCSLLGIESEAEQQEFSLYCIVQGDAFTMPLAADEYILDVTTELLKSGQPFYLIFCRSVWHFSLKRDQIPTPLYIEVLFNQVAPDYLEGLLLELPSNGIPNPDIVHDMARIAALLHRAADLNHVPAMKEIKFLLPKPALGIREIRPAQWVALVQSAWPAIVGLGPGQVKAQFLSVLSTWPLFGSSFFAVKRIWAEDGGPQVDDNNQIWKELILALNRRGVLFLDPNSHETLQHWPFMEVISTRKVRSEDGALYLDMKVGNLMQQRVIRVQTEQAHEISRLVRQYITMAQISQRDRHD